MSRSKPAIVIDNGSGFIKIGFAGQDSPRSRYPTMVGFPNSTQLMIGGQNKEYFVGYEAQAKKVLLNLRKPIQNGMISQWDDLEKIWSHGFTNELHVLPEEHPILMTEKPFTQRSHREKMLQIVFDTFNAPLFYSNIQAVFALFSLGKTTGVVWDAGEGVSHTCSVYEGINLPYATIQSTISGSSLTEYLRKRLPTESQVDFESATDIKEKHFQVSLDFKATLEDRCEEISYTLPDNSICKVGLERFTTPEILLNPSLAEENCDSVQQGIFNSIDKCVVDIRTDLYKSIVITGGTTMIKGLPERISKEVGALAQPSMKFELVSTPGRRNSVWLGGSVLASLEDFPQLCIEKNEYKEVGTSIVHRKCYV